MKTHWSVTLRRIYLTLVFPILAVMIAVRLVMTPLFLQLEYNRSGFPDDVYGFTQADRLNYAPYAVNYLINGADINYLGDLTFSDGGELFNSRELGHMRDVKAVTQTAYLVTTIAGVLAILAAWSLLRRNRDTLIAGLQYGAILTLSLIVAIVIAVVVNWEFFFTAFHTLFFESGTWMFLYSDTLIRLFPEQFWFDAALTIGGLSVAFSLLTLGVTWRLQRSALTPQLQMTGNL